MGTLTTQEYSQTSIMRTSKGRSTGLVKDIMLLYKLLYVIKYSSSPKWRKHYLGPS